MSPQRNIDNASRPALNIISLRAGTITSRRIVCPTVLTSPLFKNVSVNLCPGVFRFKETPPWIVPPSLGLASSTGCCAREDLAEVIYEEFFGKDETITKQPEMDTGYAKG